MKGSVKKKSSYPWQWLVSEEEEEEEEIHYNEHHVKIDFP